MKGRELLIYTAVFITGAAGYALIEIIYRGYTHWSMVLTGGACLLTLYITDGFMRGEPLIIKALAGAGIITLYEFAVGCIVNLYFGLGVWDYSGLRYSLHGQICPGFSAVWFLLSLCLAGISLFLYNKLQDKTRTGKRRKFK